MAIIFFIETQEKLIEQKIPFIIPIILVIHFIYLIGGLILMGIPISYILRKLVIKITPKILSSAINKSKKSYPQGNYFLDKIIWVLILPALLSSIIFFVIIPKLGYNISFGYLFYILPVIGAVYFTFESFIENIMNIKKILEE